MLENRKVLIETILLRYHPPPSISFSFNIIPPSISFSSISSFSNAPAIASSHRHWQEDVLRSCVADMAQLAAHIVAALTAAQTDPDRAREPGELIHLPFESRMFVV